MANPAAQLADAQFDLARRYGLSSWRALKAHIDSLTVNPLVSAALEQADRSEPVVTAAALLHLARVVHALDRAKGEQVLERGLAAAAALREPERTVILQEGVSLAAAVSPQHAIELAPLVTSDMPGGPMSKALFDMMGHGHSEAAADYLAQASPEDFPYDAATQAIARAGDDAIRTQILRNAIRANRAQRSKRSGGMFGGPRGFSDLFVRHLANAAGR